MSVLLLNILFIVMRNYYVVPWDACGTPTVKIRFGCTQNCKASPYIGLRKIFIDYFFFQVDQWDCTKPLSIFDRLASSEELFRKFHCTNKLQSQPIELPKIFIDDLFFQADQSDCIIAKYVRF